MRAENLLYPKASFDYAAFFYSLLHMDGPTLEEAIKEAARVLRPGGSSLIWDAEIAGSGRAFQVELDIHLPEESIHTSYGLLSEITAQNSGTLTELCEGCGLRSTYSSVRDGQLYLAFVK